MHNNTLANLKDPVAASDGANKNYVDKTHVDASGPQDNPFKYLMEDVNESSSEYNIPVHNISNFSKSPHQINKTAYNFTLIDDKDGTEQYRSRISFNLFTIPIGFYTFVVEFFPPEMRNVSVYATADTLSFGAQTSKTFQPTSSLAGYVKTVPHFEKRQAGQREYLYLDLHGKTANPDPLGHMVVYGLNGTISKVPSTVFDQVFVAKNGQMVLQADLDLSGHEVKNGSKKLFEGVAGGMGS